MNRRSFLSRLFTGIVAAKLAFELGAGKVESIEPKEQKHTIVEVNPEWFNAPYECKIVCNQDAMQAMIGTRDYSVADHDPFPLRYRMENGEFIQVPYFIAKEI